MKINKVQFKMSNKALKQLLKLRKTLDASSMAEVIRESLRLMNFALEMKKKGWKLCLIKGDRTKELILNT